MSRLGQTPAQTIGPYFAMRLAQPGDRVLATEATAGLAIRLEGHVHDGHADGVDDALVEVWQADAKGSYRSRRGPVTGAGNDSFTGFGRAATDPAGGFAFETVKPGPVTDRGGRSAPHINVIVHARGLLKPVFTRVYFDDERELNESDPVLARVPVERRTTLIATTVSIAPIRTYQFDIRLQGEGETVMFDA